MDTCCYLEIKVGVRYEDMTDFHLCLLKGGYKEGRGVPILLGGWIGWESVADGSTQRGRT